MSLLWQAAAGAADLYAGVKTWTISPVYYYDDSADGFYWYLRVECQDGNYKFGLRPLVSLKAEMEFVNNGADGTTTNPYIVE